MASRTASRCRMMCRACRRRDYRLRKKGRPGAGWRFTLKRHPSKYKREPKCPVCKSTDLYVIEHLRRRELEKQVSCICPGVPFKHRMGSHQFCVHSTRPPPQTEQEWQDQEDAYQAMINTPRSGWQ